MTKLLVPRSLVVGYRKMFDKCLVTMISALPLIPYPL